MAQVDPDADLDEEPTGPSSFALPQRAGSNTFLGLRPADWLAGLAGILQNVPLGRGPVAGNIRPFGALFPIAQGLENADQNSRNRVAIEGLAKKYGGQGNPEYDAALETMVQDPKLGSQMLFRAITSANQEKRDTRRETLVRKREDLKVARDAQAGVDVADLLGNVKVPQITSMRPIASPEEVLGPGTDSRGIPRGTGESLESPQQSVEDFTAISRPRTVDEMVQGLKALPHERQGLAAGKLIAPLEKQREKDADRLRETGDAKAAMKALGGSRGLYSASPEELESAALMLTPGTKFGAQLSMIANHRRAGDARKDALATRQADAEWRRDYLTAQRETAASNTKWQQGFSEDQERRRVQEGQERAQDRQDRLQLSRDALDARIAEWGRRAGDRQGKLGVSEQKTVQGLAVMEHWVGQAEGVLKEMKDAGMLAQGEGIVATGKGWKNRFMKPNAEALRKWQALQPGVVGFDRSILNDIGARAIKAHQGALQFFDSPPTYEAGVAVLAQMREQLNVAKANVPALIKKGQQREGIGPEEPRPGAPAEPPAPGAAPGAAPKRKWELVPEAGGAAAPAPSPQAGSGPVVAGPGKLSRQDPLYGHARSKGLTDEQIQRQFNLTLVP